MRLLLLLDTVNTASRMESNGKGKLNGKMSTIKS